MTLILGGVAAAAAPTRVVSINLCTDQLLLELAGPGQIGSLSWLAADPHESPVWAQAQRFPSNQGNVEELLALDPELVLAGRYTGTFSKAFLQRLGIPVLEIDPANSLTDIYRNIRAVAGALGRQRYGERVIDKMHRQVAAFQAASRGAPRPAMIVQPGGFTVGSRSVAHELLLLAGFDNRAAQMGLDRWGSLSLEALLASGAQRLIVASYRADAPSLANEFVNHRVFRRLASQMELVAVPAVLFACGAPQSLAAVQQMRAPVPQGTR